MNKKQKILAFISLVIACFLTVLDSTIVNVSLPSMADYFKTDISGISWVSTAYLIPFSALLINFSKIADIYGRKKLFLIGLLIFGTSSMLCGLATSLSMIIIFRILQGIGAAILAPLSIPLAIELFGKDAMSKLAIIIGMTISLAAASGPVVGGILNEVFGFKAIFYVNIPFIIISIVFGTQHLRECYDKTIERKIDFIGSLLLAYGIGALTFLLVKGSSYGWGSSKIITLIITSAVSITAFLIYEIKSKNPMIEFKLFKTKSFTSSIIIIGIIFFAYMPISYLMNFYLENQLGYTVLKSGLMLGIVSGVSFIMSPIFSIIYKRYGSRIISLLAIIFVSIGDLMFVFMNTSNNVKIIYIAFIIVGLGIGATSPLYQSAFEEISKDKNGIASGILNSFRQLTACLAIALVSTLSSAYTTQAIDNSKNRIIDIVNNNLVLEDQVKSTICDKIKISDTSKSTTFSRQMADKLITDKKKVVLASVPDNMKATVEENFKVQTKEIYTILDQANEIKNDESIKVYNKCFLITAIIALLGIIAVPFNKKNERELNKAKTELAI
ncbi:EmrB/QacA subfamily drug resistance transporter [Clostridium saccharoperbutylacetonicum]|uniref:Drug resistance transporter, EmrB/QacA subfamily n=1 Tax=Clostridium saccharoperbutylacetonicum N1-4(HMT) TaxID=931276 RepID=M1N5H7_9CLOT|nr:MFS transporter [Clostridium saccharoperbutylacetonicum]AGF58672.1 drug resistance transporter, EmrB/QacA subfamily [Clostridium saccharoperbutylacetonicum N1-4(HMT)]NRT60549.1 EmrB/QacA subfamily drug resistance transporter [Clostridium saccharoperbutylacetonicum]NSB23863.1 EmrB/QacA subfamily drug resistance transporter [Clostridium saccharoperbutylacetonicum]NSB43239.1 EmrB/QacA subfamily drug resistance transporter [Clostridium saccharoperbutylacetonicum]